MQESERFKSTKSYWVAQTLELTAKPGIGRRERVFSGFGMIVQVSGR